MHRLLVVLLLVPATGLAAGSAPPDMPAADPVLDGMIQLVESWPVGTLLDLPDVPDAAVVWPAMIETARRSIDIESFYLSGDPDRADALDTVLDALGAAARRGVRVRLVADAGFYRTYGEWVDAVGALPGAEARLLDARSLWGGIQHAKFFVVDGRSCYVGSQNWDYRALEHIHELGVRIDAPAVATAVAAVFALDWALAGGETPSVNAVAAGPWTLGVRNRDPVDCRFAASPPQGLPPGVPHDLPLLLETIDGAEHILRLHLLSYNPVDRGGDYWDALDGALRRAAARGVEVRIILSNWAGTAHALPHIRSLAVLEHVEVRFTNIPEWSGGFVPFARVEHPKYLVADDDAAWLGTSNGARSYFESSRNLSFFFAGASLCGELAAWFDNSWTSPYAETMDPCAPYEAPRRE
jgi:phosphatidylserine/phosphatidylglycerophosphate/cardiolipin synthase-like enzyme